MKTEIPFFCMLNTGRGVIFMARKRLTQRFPFLLPLRQKQKKLCFYLKLRWDKNHYSKQIQKELYPEIIFEDMTVLINEKSGMDIQYQYNKVHNLKLVAKTINGLIIQPNETFSFWCCAKDAEKLERYKDGLSLVDGKLVSVHGGGLCQITNLLFWCFIHSPLTIVERHTHFMKAFPDPPSRIPDGVDATVSEGWKDLKVRNDTKEAIQIQLEVQEDVLYVALRGLKANHERIKIEARNKHFVYENDECYEIIEIWQITSNEEKLLYTNRCRIGYSIEESEE